MRTLFILITLILMAMPQALADNTYYLAGIVRDSLTTEPLPMAAVTIGGNATGVLTDSKGIFELTVDETARQLHVTCLGYRKKTVPISKNAFNLYDVELVPEVQELNEVVITRKKYSKKNNPAVDFAERLRRMGPQTDPERNDWYNYDKHQLTTVAFNDFVQRDENSWMFRKFPFLWEHIDTSEVSGKPILTVMSKEKTSQVHYRKTPRSTKEVITGIREAGLDEVANMGSMQTFFDDALPEIDLYNNDVTLLQNRFVSPLSRIAPDFYKFYLTDTVTLGNERCIVLSFYPHNPAAFGFNGQLYVPEGDSTMFIRKVTMRSPRDINLNFIDNIYISQEFERAPDGSRLKMRDDIIVELKVLSSKPGFYAKRSVAYANHNFQPLDDQSVFSQLGSEVVEDSAHHQSDEFWDIHRLTEVTENEKNVDKLMARLRSVPAYYWTEYFLKYVFRGYIGIGQRPKFEYGPVNTTVSSNTLEGVRLRGGFTTTAYLNPHLFGRGYLAYGIRDHKFKYLAELEYSFNKKEYHKNEFPVHSFRLSSNYDVDQLGQQYLFTNSDNFVLSLKRQTDDVVTYRWTNNLDYTLELANHFSVTASLLNERQDASRFVKFIDGYGRLYDSYTENSLNVTLRYAPGEKFYQTRSNRVPINVDGVQVTLGHTIAPKGFAGSMFTVNKTEATLWKRFWLSAWGYTDILVKGGHVWSTSPFPNLLIPNANLSYTIQPESFALMNAMEFVNDTYASLDFTYWANGAIFNYIPYFKRLKLREVFAFRGLWGHLSDKNDPKINPEVFAFPFQAGATRMSNRPYMEASVGLDNIFSVLRVDYVWRLSYLDVPYPIDRRGLRVAVHVTF